MLKTPKWSSLSVLSALRAFFKKNFIKVVPTHQYLEILESFCYFWALDMATTWAVPGLFYFTLGHYHCVQYITVHRQAILLFSWNPGHENWEKSWSPGQNFSLKLSVSWIPRQCLSWIPRQYCCYNDTFAAALWLVRWFWVIIFGKVEKFKLIQFYINGTCFDWHEKSQSTNRDTHDWYQN